MNPSGKILLFDGVCNLCNALVRFVIKHDSKSVIRFCPLQSESGKKFLHSSASNDTLIDTVVYIHCKKYLVKSTAVIYLLRDLGGIWVIFYGLIVIPVFIRDYLYDKIAANRYRIFGRTDICMVPSPDVKERFIV